MTNEMHVTISAAQQGGMHPLRLPCVFLSQMNALLARARKRRRRWLRKEKGRNYCLLHSLRLKTPDYYHTKKKATWQILDAEISVRLNKLKIVQWRCAYLYTLSLHAQIHSTYRILWIFILYILNIMYVQGVP